MLKSLSNLLKFTLLIWSGVRIKPYSPESGLVLLPQNKNNTADTKPKFSKVLVHTYSSEMS